MTETIRIYCQNNNTYKDFPIGSSLMQIFKGFNLDFPYPVLSAKVNNRAEGLNFRVYNNKDIEFLDFRDLSGMRTYVRSLCFVFVRRWLMFFRMERFFCNTPFQRAIFVTFFLVVP
jgi:hypothetical protein